MIFKQKFSLPWPAEEINLHEQAIKAYLIEEAWWLGTVGAYILIKNNNIIASVSSFNAPNLRPETHIETQMRITEAEWLLQD